VKRLALAAAALLAVLIATPTARADENRECDNNQDVTVVVDFGDLGGGVNVRCAPQGSDGIDSGFDALEHAQVSYEQSGGFVCRIAGRPESGECTDRPSSGPYWAYYYAKRGGEWKYSNYGAGTRKPPPGSIEGWAYTDSEGHATPPEYPVPAPIADTTTTAATPAAPQEPSPTTRVRSSGGTAATTPRTVLEMPTTTTVVGGVVSVADDPTTTSVKLGNVDLSVDHGGGGTSAGFIASLGAVVGLVAIAAAFLRARAR
jgi:hypothetical protein